MKVDGRMLQHAGRPALLLAPTASVEGEDRNAATFCTTPANVNVEPINEGKTSGGAVGRTCDLFQQAEISPSRENISGEEVDIL